MVYEDLGDEGKLHRVRSQHLERPTMPWCRKRSIQQGERVSRQYEIRSRAVLADMRNGAGFRYWNHAVAVHRPGQCDLRGCSADLLRQLGKGGFCDEPPLLNRAVSHHRHGMILQPGQQVMLGTPS